MADDTLVKKAAWALTDWLLKEVCGRCAARPMLSNHCVKRACVVPGLVQRADEGARAVLEATRADKALEACKWIIAADRLAMARVIKWHKFSPLSYEACASKERLALARAKRLACKALGCWRLEAVLHRVGKEVGQGG